MTHLTTCKNLMTHLAISWTWTQTSILKNLHQTHMLGTFAQPGLMIGQAGQAVASQEATQVEILEVIQAAPTPTQEYSRSLKTRPTLEARHAQFAIELQEDGIEPRGVAGITMASLFTLGVTACS